MHWPVWGRAKFFWNSPMQLPAILARCKKIGLKVLGQAVTQFYPNKHSCKTLAPTLIGLHHSYKIQHDSCFSCVGKMLLKSMFIIGFITCVKRKTTETLEWTTDALQMLNWEIEGNLEVSGWHEFRDAPLDLGGVGSFLKKKSPSSWGWKEKLPPVRGGNETIHPCLQGKIFLEIFSKKKKITLTKGTNPPPPPAVKQGKKNKLPTHPWKWCIPYSLNVKEWKVHSPSEWKQFHS